MSSLNEYIESVQIAVMRLDDYGLAKSVEFNSEFRKEEEVFVTGKATLINDSEIYLREYVNGKNAINFIGEIIQQNGLICDITTFSYYGLSKNR